MYMYSFSVYIIARSYRISKMKYIYIYEVESETSEQAITLKPSSKMSICTQYMLADEIV